MHCFAVKDVCSRLVGVRGGRGAGEGSLRNLPQNILK